jgi:hypothetical protein
VSRLESSLYIVTVGSTRLGELWIAAASPTDDTRRNADYLSCRHPRCNQILSGESDQRCLAIGIRSQHSHT